MIPNRIIGATRNLGAPADWKDDQSGPCAHLPIVDTVEGGLPYMTSAWAPLPEELAALNRGGSVLLRICGVSHPVVSVGVSLPVDLDGEAG